MLVLDGAGIALALDEVVHHAGVQGPRTVEGVDGDDVLEAGGAQLPEDVLHARAFKLEDAVGVSPGEQVVGRLVVHGDPGDGEQLRCSQGRPGHAIIDVLHRFVDDRESAESEEVELDQSYLLHALHVELGGDLVLGCLEEGKVLGQRLGRDDNAGGVLGRVPDLPFEAARDIDQLRDPRVLHQLLELGLLFDGVFQGDVKGVRHQLGNLVDLGVGEVEHPSHVPYHAFGHHGAIRDDLGDMVLAVLFGHVLR